MQEAPLPSDEPERLDAVRRYDVLDTPPDGAFDRVTRLAARLFDVPISIISIVDHDRIWFKSHHGLDVTEIDRAPGLCASAICEVEPWIVNDARVDPRTLENSLVAGELGLRFYVGVPLRTADGHNLGTLNVIDFEPRTVTDEELQTLQELAGVVMDELELRLAARSQLEERRRRALELHDDVVQRLAYAQVALEAGLIDDARAAVAATLKTAQATVEELLVSAGEHGVLAPGDLVRRRPATLQ